MVKTIDRVHVTRNRSGGGKRRSLVQVHASPLGEEDVATIDGLHVTSLSRTVIDLCRTVPFEQAVAAGDRAVRLGLPATALDEALDEALSLLEGWPGIRQARRAIAFLDARSESAGESVSRVRIYEAGLPRPVPQREIYGPDGRLVGRVDFCWEQQQTVGEFDGKIKYGRLLKPGQAIEEVLFEDGVKTLFVILFGRSSDGFGLILPSGCHSRPSSEGLCPCSLSAPRRLRTCCASCNRRVAFLKAARRMKGGSM